MLAITNIEKHNVKPSFQNSYQPYGLLFQLIRFGTYFFYFFVENMIIGRYLRKLAANLSQDLGNPAKSVSKTQQIQPKHNVSLIAVNNKINKSIYNR